MKISLEMLPKLLLNMLFEPHKHLNSVQNKSRNPDITQHFEQLFEKLQLAVICMKEGRA